MYTNKAFSNFKISAFLLYKAVVKSILKFSKGEVFILTIQKVFGIDYSTCCFHYRNFPNDGDHLPPPPFKKFGIFMSIFDWPI